MASASPSIKLKFFMLRIKFVWKIRASWPIFPSGCLLYQQNPKILFSRVRSIFILRSAGLEGSICLDSTRWSPTGWSFTFLGSLKYKNAQILQCVSRRIQAEVMNASFLQWGIGIYGNKGKTPPVQCKAKVAELLHYELLLAYSGENRSFRGEMASGKQLKLTSILWTPNWLRGLKNNRTTDHKSWEARTVSEWREEIILQCSTRANANIIQYDAEKMKQESYW